jgi:hypothetical protein
MSMAQNPNVFVNAEEVSNVNRKHFPLMTLDTIPDFMR